MGKQKKNPRVLLTGATGYIGAPLRSELLKQGYEVVEVSRSGAADGRRSSDTHDKRRNSDTELLQLDLTDSETSRRKLAELAPCSVIIHAASHTALKGGAGPVNEAMLSNIVWAAERWQARLIQMGTVAIYGESGRDEPIAVGDPLRPASAYGRSKQRCEELIQASSLSDWRILRLAPVFSPDRMRNAAVRVYLPGTRLRLRVLPPED